MWPQDTGAYITPSMASQFPFLSLHKVEAEQEMDFLYSIHYISAKYDSSFLPK